MIDLIPCPSCGAVAEIFDRSAWDSTDGPIEHVRTRCVQGHYFYMPTEHLIGADQ